MRVTKTATPRAGPVVWIILKSANAIAASPTMTVAALAVMTAPIRFTVSRTARCQSSCPTSSL